MPNLAVNTDAPPAALRAGHGSPATLVRYTSSMRVADAGADTSEDT